MADPVCALGQQDRPDLADSAKNAVCLVEDDIFEFVGSFQLALGLGKPAGQLLERCLSCER